MQACSHPFEDNSKSIEEELQNEIPNERIMQRAAETDKANELPFDIINLLRAFLGDYASAQMEKSSKEIIECVQSHGIDPLICGDNVFRMVSEERWRRQHKRETMFFIIPCICFPCEFVALIIFNIAYLLTCACCWLDLSRVTGF